MIENHRDVLGFALVALLQQEHHFMEHVVRLSAKEIPGRSTPRVADGKNKKQQVGYGHEAFGNLLVGFLDRIGSRRVDQIEIL